MKLKDLRSAAKILGIRGYSKMKVAELQTAIRLKQTKFILVQDETSSYGPFDTESDAEDYAEKADLDCHWFVLPITPVECDEEGEWIIHDRAWVFTKEGTQVVIGELNEFEARNADEAYQQFDCADHFDVYFRTRDGVLHSVADDSRPEDFPG